MGFEGSEFYFEEWPELIGKSFFEITCRFDEAVPLGIMAASDGKLHINPENDHRVCEGDKILVLAEDNDDYKIKNKGSVPTAKRKGEQNPERILFCGWRR